MIPPFGMLPVERRFRDGRSFCVKGTGFTLAELLIALLILGVISTFAIPKVLYAQQNGTYKAIGKEVAGMVSEAMMIHRYNGNLSADTIPQDITPYLNYVAIDTTSTIDEVPGSLDLQCGSGSYPMCVKMHTGGVLAFYSGNFGGTSNADAIWFAIDPDGKYSGSANGNGKSLWFGVTYNGRLTTWGSWTNDPSQDPTWFSW